MVNAIHNPFDKVITNTIVAVAASTFLIVPGTSAIPYSQVHNTVVFQKQKNTSLDFSSIDRLKRDFSMTDTAEHYLHYYDFTNILITAKQHIREYFPNEPLLIDIDMAEQEKILLLIQTHLSVSKASMLLDALDEAWVIDHIDELKNIVIDVMFL